MRTVPLWGTVMGELGNLNVVERLGTNCYIVTCPDVSLLDRVIQLANARHLILLSHNPGSLGDRQPRPYMFDTIYDATNKEISILRL